MNSFSVWICKKCGKKFSVALIMLPQWDKKCLRCQSKNLKKMGIYNPNSPTDEKRFKKDLAKVSNVKKMKSVNKQKVKITTKDDCCVFCNNHFEHYVGRLIAPHIMETEQGFVIEHIDKCYILICSNCAERKIKDLINRGGVR